MDREMETVMRLDAWLERDEGGTVPGDLLRQRGVEIVDPAELDDPSLSRKLWEVIEAAGEIGIYLTFTDHLSDRELYERLVSDMLPEETFLDPEDPTLADIWSPIGGCSNEDNRIYLTYYADEKTRRGWQSDFGEPVPPRQPLPFDRDRLLPSFEERMTSRWNHLRS